MKPAARTVITGGRVIDPASGVDGEHSVFIADGRIVAVGDVPDGFQTEREIHVPRQIVCPGFIDLCARLREPGFEHKATIASETTAAAAAGITTLCCPPDTNPVIDTAAVVELIQYRAASTGRARVLPIGALTQALKGRELSEMSALKAAGCIAVGNALAPLASSLVLRRAIEYAASYDLLVIIRPEDAALRASGCAHEGAVGTRLGLPGIPETAETAAVAQALALIEVAGVRAHFAQLSCARSVTLISRAQSDGVAVTADVAAHQLHLTEQDIEHFNALCHVIPPLRSARDREGLRAGVASGVISAICTDHQPHEEGAKLKPFPSTEPGVSSLATLLPLTLGLVREGVLGLPEAIARLTTGPAAILRSPFGTLRPGSPADVCIFEPQAEWTADAAEWRSRGRNSPFWGKPMTGRVSLTLLGGEIVHSRRTQADI